MYQNSNMWDRLRVCAVGRSWPAEFYYWIDDPVIRDAIEKIAHETENDYQNLIDCLQGQGVTVVRPCIDITVDDPNLVQHILQRRPPMNPGDDLIMLNTTLIQSFTPKGQHSGFYNNIVDHVVQQGNIVVDTDIDSLCGAGVYQLGQRIFFTTLAPKKAQFTSMTNIIKQYSNINDVHRMHQFGHIDGWFTPVTPGLIITSADPARPELLTLFFKTYFPDWEVITMPPTLTNSHLFRAWCNQHTGSWWISGQEHNTNFTNFVDDYFINWVGNVQETVFELNMIVIDQHNVVVSHYDKQIFDAFKRHNVTPHHVPLRHANFWDGGIHCIITELHREN